MRQRSFARLALAALCAGALSGCATYTDQLATAYREASGGNYQGAIVEMNTLIGVPSANDLPQQWTGDRPLATLERGTLQQALAQFPSSARDFSASEGELELLDMKTDPVGTLGAYLYSDSAKTYRTPPTERLALNAVNMLNYLGAGDLDGAAVEARRFQVMRDYLTTLDIQADSPAALGAYLAGFVFEHRGEGDRALRYYEEALAAGRLSSLDAPIARLARSNPYRGPRLSEVVKQQRGTSAAASRPSELLIVLSVGRVPHREPARIPLGAAVGIAGTYISGNVDWLKYGATKLIVYPEIADTPSTLGGATVQVDGTAVELDPLTDLGAAIRSEYEEAKPKIIAAALTRMAARGAMAEGVRAGGKKESDALGDVLAILFEGTMVALDRPDTRSWTMLANNILVARVPVPPGEHNVEVAFGGASRRSQSVTVPKNGFAAVVVTEPR